jgi:hypothetical protein
MPAATIPAAYVRARWAYSELLSGRPYRGIGVQDLKRKALGHVPFDDLRREERDQLEQAWYRVRGVPTFINAFAGIATFELVHWSKEQLGAVHVIKYFAQEVGNHSVPMSFKQWIETEPPGSIEPGHARHAASGAGPSTGVEPVTVGQLSGLLTLIDGYHRAVRFWKKGRRKSDRLAVYVPVSA